MNITQLDWQTVVALLIVLIAIAVFSRKTWKSVFAKTTTGCGTSCNGCPIGSTIPNNGLKVTKVVQLGANKPTSTSQRQKSQPS